MWASYVGWGSEQANAKGKMEREVEIDVPREKGYIRKLSTSLVYPDNFLLIHER